MADFNNESNSTDIQLVPLTQGFYAIVDVVDFVVVSMHKWRADSHGYHSGVLLVYGKRDVRKIDGTWTTQYLHDFILNIKGVDHKNGNGLDNRRSNLRPANQSQNLPNQRKRSGVSSRYKGVTWDKDNNKWRAQIQVDGRHIHLGRYIDETEAALAYVQAAHEYFGEFANVEPLSGT